MYIHTNKHLYCTVLSIRHESKAKVVTGWQKNTTC